MFDGSFKSKRAINLSGNKQQVDKQKLLRQAQEERRIREAERSRQKAAERIQAWYRGRSVAVKLRQGLRSSWDQETQALAHQQHIYSGTALSSLSPASINQLAQGIEFVVQRFLFFFRPRYDHQRLVQLCGLLLLPIGGNEGRIFHIPYYRASSHHAEWSVLLGRLLRVLIKHLGEYSNWEEGDSIQTLTLLEALTLAESFQTSSGLNVSVNPSKGFSQILYKAGAFAQCVRFLNGISVDEKNRLSVTKSLLLSVRICNTFDNSAEFSQALDQFITHILTIPLLTNRMATDTQRTFASRLPLEAVLLHLSATSCSTVASLPLPKIIFLVANILAFGHQRVAKMSLPVSSAYLHVLTMLLGMIPQDSIEPPDANADDDDDVEMEDERGETTLDLHGASVSTKLDPRIMESLSLAHDKTLLRDILGSLEPSAAATGGAQEIFSAEAIGDITSLLLNLITLFPSHRKDILDSLVFFRFGKSKQASNYGKSLGISIIKIFLDAFMATTLYSKLAQSLSTDTPLSTQLVLNSAHGKAWSLLAFVSELYCHILVTMGDDEFHDDARNPISLRCVVTLSSVVRDVAFLLWWNDNALDMKASLGGSKNLKVGYLRDKVTNLTRQLHARDSRRPYCPKDHWLVSMPLDMIAFKKAVIQDEESISQNPDSDEDSSTIIDPNIARVRRNISREQRGTQLARKSPGLGVLNNIPFVIRFEDRVAIFRAFIDSDRRRIIGSSFEFNPHPVESARINRGNVFEDGFKELNHLGRRLKQRVSISFIDQYGLQEAGIDGGGVFKEFLTSLVRQSFDINYGLFKNTSDQLLYPNPHRFAQEPTQLQHYEFLGRILGKALYEGILIDVAFAGFFLSKCLGQANFLDDLPSLDPELYRGLMFLKNYDGNVEDLSLYFTVDVEEMGRTIARDLVHNGSNILVTRENRIKYIFLAAYYRLNTQIDRQCKAFFRGLSDLIDPKWLWMFNQQELQIMFGGAKTAISLKDLQQNVVYSNYEPTDQTIQYFWSVVEEMSEDDRRLLIKFITSCARPPLMGFAELNPKLCIRNAGNEEDRLPTSSTCMNLLKLPAFSTRQKLKEKLLYAIHSEAGFDLS